MAAADKTKVVEFVTDAIVVLPGIPVPATAIPATRPSVLTVVTVVVPFLTQESEPGPVLSIKI